MLVGLLALAPVGVAAVLVVGGGLGTTDELMRQLYDSLVMTTIVPLVALILGTTAIGAEIDDGTVVHLLVKPVGRAWIVLAKMLVAAAAGVGLCGTSVLVTGFLLLRLDSPGLLLGMLVGTLIAVVAYTAVFVTLSVWTGRALIAGLAYVLLWEGFIATLFSGTRLLSIREYGLAVAAGIAGPEAGSLHQDVTLASGLALAVIVTIIAFWLGSRRLARFEISDAG